MLIPDFPAAAGRAGYAVGLDVPGSVLAMLQDLREAGYAVEGITETPRALMRMLARERLSAGAGEYACRAAAVPEAARRAVASAWGPAEAEAAGGAFGFRFARFGNVTVALAPDRGRNADRRADYHDPALPPRRMRWWRSGCGCAAQGAGGRLRSCTWGARDAGVAAGKTVALSEGCFPEVVAGALPVVYPFIVANPGEAARRSGGSAR